MFVEKTDAEATKKMWEYEYYHKTDKITTANYSNKDMWLGLNSYAHTEAASLQN